MKLLSLGLAVVLLVASCASPEARPFQPIIPTSSASTTPTPTPAPVFWPLRGTLAPSAEAINRRPMLVRIPNDTAARPQSGLAKADMVWELLAEGGITRYMAVFHSAEADQVGPIRSARLSDLHYAPMFRGILAHVGASQVVLARIRAAAGRGEFIDVDQFLFSSYYTRVGFRAPPQNVYTSTERLREAARVAGDAGGVDVPLFVATPSPLSANGKGTPSSKFAVPYLGAMRATYLYAPKEEGYTRSQGDATTIDAATGRPIVITNVVVIRTDITPQPGIVEDSLGSVSLEIRSTGTGPATIFTRGVRIDGTWKRSATDGYTFVDESGSAIPLTPGQTWVHVIPSDWEVESAE